jgi:SMI1 / KNR4 family (SUKH-1)
MDYLQLFQRAQAHLKGLQVESSFYPGGHVIDWDLWAAKDTMKRPLPEDLRQFYLEVGNGLSFNWKAESAKQYPPFANVEVPSLWSLGRGYLEYQDGECYSPEKAEEYGFPYTKDRQLAKRTAARMWHWLPVFAEGNGDKICLDLSLPSCPVIFHKHDWHDGGSGDNGHLLAENWKAFLTRWASVCFQCPKSLWWVSAFKPGGGVSWEGEQFRASFRIEGLAEPGCGS